MLFINCEFSEAQRQRMCELMCAKDSEKMRSVCVLRRVAASEREKAIKETEADQVKETDKWLID